LSPVDVLWGRVAIGAAVIVPVAWASVGARATARHVGRAWPRLLLLGLLSMVWTTLAVSWAEGRLASSLTAVIQAGTPLFTALLALLLARQDRLTRARLVGLVIGFAGVALVVGVQPR